MSEGSLKEEIMRRAKEKASSLLKEVEEEENRALAELDEKMAAQMERELSKYREQLKERELEELARARLEGKRALSIAKENLYQKALDESVDYFLSSDLYKKYLKNVIESAKKKYPKDELKVHCNKADGKLVKPLLPENAVLKTDLDDRGVKIEVGKHGLVLNNTLETLLTEKGDKLRAFFYSKVFEGDQ